MTRTPSKVHLQQPNERAHCAARGELKQCANLPNFSHSTSIPTPISYLRRRPCLYPIPLSKANRAASLLISLSSQASPLTIITSPSSSSHSSLFSSPPRFFCICVRASLSFGFVQYTLLQRIDFASHSFSPYDLLIRGFSQDTLSFYLS